MSRRQEVARRFRPSAREVFVTSGRPRRGEQPGPRVGLVEKQRPGGGDEHGSTAPATPSGGPGGGGPGIGVRVVAAVTVVEAVGLAALAGWGVTRLVAGAEPDVGTGVF